MAVAHSASSESHTGTTGSVSQASFAWTHTQTGTPQGVLVFVHVMNNATDTVTSVTYGTVTLTRVPGGAAIDSAGEPGRTDLFFAGSGLGTGNQTITVNRLNNTRVMYATAATVTAATNTNVTGIVLLQGDQALTQQNVNDGSPGTNSLRYAGTFSGLNAPPAAGANSTLLQSIDIGNQTAALVRETAAGQGSRPVGFTGTSDDVAAVHVAVRELFNRTETPIVGAFALTGNDATLTEASPKSITAETGTFTLTGNQATLSVGYTTTGERGSFALTGNQATLKHNPTVTGERGSFALSGKDATFKVSHVLGADVGTFALTGNQATLEHNPSVTGEVGTFTLTGQNTTLQVARKLTAETGTFALTGNPATFAKLRGITVEAGIFALTGNAVTLTKVAAKELNAEVGTFTLDGKDVALTRAYTLIATPGAYALTGNDVTFRWDRAVTLPVGQFTLAGLPIAFQSTTTVLAETGLFALTGNDLSFSRTYNAQLDVGAFSLTAPAIDLEYEQRRRVVFVF